MKKNASSAVIYNYKYYKTAERLRIIRYIAALLLALCLFAFFFIYKENITVKHLKYFARNIDFTPNSVLTSGENIYYSADRESDFALVSGGFVFMTDTRVSVVDKTSSAVLSEYHGYLTPILATSKKYLAVYDRTGSSVTLYNAFSKIKTLTFDGCVKSVSVADNGAIAVAVSSNSDYYSTVYVYDRSLELVNTISKYKYVTDVELSSDGKSLLVTSIYTDKNGILSSEALLMTVGKKTADKTLTASETSIWDAKLFSNRDFALLFDSSLIFYQSDGTPKGTVSFSERTPYRYYIGESYAVLAFSCSDSRKSDILVYSHSGELLYELCDFYGRVSDISSDKENIYILTDTKLISLSNGKAKEALLDFNAASLVESDDTVFIAASDEARRITEDFFDAKE